MSTSQSEPTMGISWTEMLDRVGASVTSLKVTGCISREDREQVLSVLRAYTAARSEDFKQFVQFSDQGYTKNLVTEIGDGLANIIVMCWAPRQASAFHGHEGSRCFVKVLQGELLEERVAHPSNHCSSDSITTGGDDGGGQSCKHQTIMRTNEVTYIDDSIGCHRVTNKSGSGPAVTLHVYTPPYRKCRLFELDGHPTPGMGELDANGQGQRPPICMARSRTIDVTFNNAIFENQS